MTQTEHRVLRVAVDRYGYTADIHSGELALDGAAFDMVDVTPVNRAFRPMVERSAFDVSELAIATYLQAYAAGKPLVLVPVVLMNRFHHDSLVKRAGSALGPRDLAGKRIGVRAYAQTTAVWVRGVLASDYGVDSDTIRWVALEGAHVAEYADPPNVERAPANASLATLLADAEIDAWVAGRDASGVPGIEPVIPDAAHAQRAWFARTGALPVNHMLAVTWDLVHDRPAIVAELVGLFETAKRRWFERLRATRPAGAEEAFALELLDAGIDPLPSGVEALRRSLELVIGFCVEQHLIPSPIAVDDLFRTEHPS